ncbi:MAG TPA: sialidase family protein [Armatimonadota bacterium]|jgi:hypothetical protein
MNHTARLAIVLGLACTEAATAEAHVVRRPAFRPYQAGAAVRRSAVKGPEVNASQDPRSVFSETFVAVNPADPAVIVAGSNHIQFSAPMAGFVSRDRGASFSRLDPPQRLGGALYAETTDPSIAFDRHGNAYCSFLMAQNAVGLYRPVVAVMPAGQTAWLGPFAVSSAVADDDKSMMTVDASPTSPFAGRVYVAWDRNAADGSQTVYLGRSDGGQTWLQPARVDDATSSGSAIYAAPACGPNGEVYVVWNDYAAANAGSILIDRSLDGGVTFGGDISVTDLRVNLQPNPADSRSIYAIPAQPHRGIAACPSVGVDITSGPRRGWVYVCYCDCSPGKAHDDVDIFVRRSVDSGVTWSAPVRVNDDLGATSQFWPWMSVDPVDGSLNVVFYDCRDDSGNKKANVYYARSRNGGVTFEPNVKVTAIPSDQSTGSADPSGNDYGDYLGVSAWGGQICAAWTDSRDGYNQAFAETLVQSAAAPTGLAQTACKVTVPSGAALSSRGIILSALLDGPAQNLVAEWEVKPAATAFNGAGTTLSPAVAYSGEPAPVSLSLTGLSSGGYRWRVRGVRADGLGAPGDWSAPGGNPDFTIGGPPITTLDVARAARLAAGGVAASALDALRLDVSAADGRKECDGAVSLVDAVRLARSLAGLDTIP